MNRLAKLIEGLDKSDLRLIKKDLETGNIERLINTKLTEIKQTDFNKVCPVCQTPLEEEGFTLVFGPKGLRKKASFCAQDCLEYFLNKIKQEKKRVVE
jgi:replicative superfamily II helicase